MSCVPECTPQQVYFIVCLFFNIKCDIFVFFLQKIPVRDRFNGKPVFSREPLSGKMEVSRSKVDNLTRFVYTVRPARPPVVSTITLRKWVSVGYHSHLCICVYKVQNDTYQHI